jgi:hypothetical protein
MNDEKRQKILRTYRMASNYVYWREVMGLCQKRSLVSCCGKCRSSTICQVHRSYAEANNVLEFINRGAK